MQKNRNKISTVGFPKLFQKVGVGTAICLSALIGTAKTAEAVCVGAPNGIIAPTEACDDGNVVAGDGCNATCDIEPSYSCARTLDFNQLTNHDFPGSNANWVIAPDGLSGLQTVNSSRPTFALFGESSKQGTFATQWEVQTTGDDDWMGVAFGFNPGDEVNPNADYLLLTWKQADQGPYVEGMFLKHVLGARAGDIALNNCSAPGSLGPPSVGPCVKVLLSADDLGQPGWADNTVYNVHTTYRDDHLQIVIDGKVIADVSPSDFPGEFASNMFPDGQMGLYTFSQEQVAYRNLAPFGPSICNSSSLSDATINVDVGSGPVVIDVASLFSDANDALVTNGISIIDISGGATAVDPSSGANDGTVVLTPNDGSIPGVYSVTFTACDNHPIIPHCETATVIINYVEDGDDDGMSNIVDLDDDNDGIPDIVENPPTFSSDVEYGLTTTGNLSNTCADGTFTVAQVATSGDYPFAMFGNATSVQGIQLGWNQEADRAFDFDVMVNPTGTALLKSFSFGLGGPGFISGVQSKEKEIQISWNIGGNGILRDPDSQVDSHINGAIISSGDIMHFTTSSGTDSTWFVEVPLHAAAGPLVLNYISFNAGVREAGGILNEIFWFDTALACDTDGDGIPNDQDLDSDNDGILDSLEVGADLSNPVDTDGDGVPDYLDLDTDNDGLPDVVEAGHDGADANNDGRVDGPVGDNGLVDSLETMADSGVVDYNSDGNGPDSPVNTDGMGPADYRDLDSDNDGINDVIEAGGTDADGNGMQDPIDGTPDADGDGLIDSVDSDEGGIALPVPDSDSDGVDDYRDLDSDNDTITDLVEGGSAGIDLDSNGVVDGPDTDGDGINDSVDGLVGHGDEGSPNLPDNDADTDANSPDYIDVDSDGDGTNDIAEAGLGSLDVNGDGMVDDMADVDGDGIADVFDDSDGDGTPDSMDPDPGSFGSISTTPADLDGDGIADGIDLDDDNDGILDSLEGSGGLNPVADDDNDGIPNYLDVDASTCDDSDSNGVCDSVGMAFDFDGDGVPNHQDVDSDGDGISDAEESGLGGVDSNGDGVLDCAGGFGANGLCDEVETSPESGTTGDIRDTDDDGAPDFLDIDSDNDGIGDKDEAGDDDLGTPPADTDGDGTPDYRDTDSDNDGINDEDEAGDNDPSTPPVDTDGDGIPDYRDTDSDNDGIDDEDEGDGDTDGDGIPDFRDLDSSGDGVGDGVVVTGGGCSTGGQGSTGSMALWLLLGLAFLGRRRHTRND